MRNLLTALLLCGIILPINAATLCLDIGGDNTTCKNFNSNERIIIRKVPQGTVIQPLNKRIRKSPLAESLEGWNPRPCELALGCTGEYR